MQLTYTAAVGIFSGIALTNIVAGENVASIQIVCDDVVSVALDYTNAECQRLCKILSTDLDLFLSSCRPVTKDFNGGVETCFSNYVLGRAPNGGSDEISTIADVNSGVECQSQCQSNADCIFWQYGVENKNCTLKTAPVTQKALLTHIFPQESTMPLSVDPRNEVCDLRFALGCISGDHECLSCGHSNTFRCLFKNANFLAGPKLCPKYSAYSFCESVPSLYAPEEHSDDGSSRGCKDGNLDLVFLVDTSVKTRKLYDMFGLGDAALVAEVVQQSLGIKDGYMKVSVDFFGPAAALEDKCLIEGVPVTVFDKNAKLEITFPEESAESLPELTESNMLSALMASFKAHEMTAESQKLVIVITDRPIVEPEEGSSSVSLEGCPSLEKYGAVRQLVKQDLNAEVFFFTPEIAIYNSLRSINDYLAQPLDSVQSSDIDGRVLVTNAGRAATRLGSGCNMPHKIRTDVGKK